VEERGKKVRGQTVGLSATSKRSTLPFSDPVNILFFPGNYAAQRDPHSFIQVASLGGKRWNVLHYAKIRDSSTRMRGGCQLPDIETLLHNFLSLNE